MCNISEAQDSMSKIKEHLGKTLTGGWDWIFPNDLGWNCIEREKSTIYYTSKNSWKPSLRKEKIPHQALDCNTLCKISNDTEIFHLVFCFHNESEDKTSKQ